MLLTPTSEMLSACLSLRRLRHHGLQNSLSSKTGSSSHQGCLSSWIKRSMPSGETRLIWFQVHIDIFYRKSINYKVPINLEAENPEAWQKEEQEKIDTAEPLTEEQTAEKEGLFQKGFADWTRKDFNHFVRACAEFGRDDVDSICKEVEGKDPDEVRAYAKIFWERKDELQDQDRIMSIIEKGEQKIQRKKDIRRALSAKMARYRSPFHQLHIVYGTNKGKNYTEEEDRFLVSLMFPTYRRVK